MAKFNLQQIEEIWIVNGGDPSVAPQMAAIAMAESGGDPNAMNHNTNGTTDRGLWQINDVNNATIPGGVGNAFDPNANAKSAIKILKSSGAHAWTTYTSGAFAQFLPQARAVLTAAEATAKKLGALAGAQAGGITGAVGGAASAVGGAVSGAADAVGSVASGVGSIASLLTSIDFWKRLGEGIAGVILIAIGLRSLTGQSTSPIDLAGKAAKVVR